MARVALAGPVPAGVILGWQCLKGFSFSRLPLGKVFKLGKSGHASRVALVS